MRLTQVQVDRLVKRELFKKRLCRIMDAAGESLCFAAAVYVCVIIVVLGGMFALVLSPYLVYKAVVKLLKGRAVAANAEPVHE